MKYKVGRDLPKFAKEYNTISPSELARIVSKERKKVITPESVTMWFKRHPEIYSQLAKLVKNRTAEETSKEIPEVLAKLITYNHGTIEIINLETVELARKQLVLIEADFKNEICEHAKLQVIRRIFT